MNVAHIHEQKYLVVFAEPWGETSYDEALGLQSKLSQQGNIGWLFFACPPTITLGNRAQSHDILVSQELLKAKGIRVVEVDRGGQVTYHGPGQIIGFPIGSLHAHMGDSRAARAFVDDVRARLEVVVRKYKTLAVPAEGEQNVGVWVLENDCPAKIASLGMRFSRDEIRHGFALNINEQVRTGFKLINPCGESRASVAWLGVASVATVRDELSRAFSPAALSTENS